MSFGNSFIPRTLLSKDTDKRRIHPLQRNTNILLSSFLSSYDSSTNVVVLSETDHLISSKSHTKNANHCSNARNKDQIHNRLPDEKSHNQDDALRSIPRTLLSKDADKKKIYPLHRNTNILFNSFLSSNKRSTNVAVLSVTGHLINGTKNINHRTNAKTKDQIHNRLPDVKSHNHDNSLLSNSKTKNANYYQRTNSKKENKNYYERNKTQLTKKIKKTFNREEEFKKPNQNSNLRSDAKRQYQNYNFYTVSKRQEQHNFRSVNDKKRIGCGNFHTGTTEGYYQNYFRITSARKQDIFFSNFCTDVKDKNYISCNNARRQQFKEFKNHFEVYEEYGKIPLYCDICDVKVNEVEPMMEHFSCQKHRKNMNNPRLKNHINFAEYDRRLELLAKILDMRKNNIYGCELCKVVFSTRFKLAFHKKSKDHEEVLLRQSLLLGQSLLGRAYLGQKLA